VTIHASRFGPKILHKLDEETKAAPLAEVELAALGGTQQMKFCSCGRNAQGGDLGETRVKLSPQESLRGCGDLIGRENSAEASYALTLKAGQGLEENAALKLSASRDIGEFAVSAAEQVLSGNGQFQVATRFPAESGVHRHIIGHRRIRQRRHRVMKYRDRFEEPANVFQFQD